MKTTVKTISLIITLAIISSVTLSASVLNFSEELYIDDIPFDTKCVTTNCLYNDALSTNFQLEEEEYIDDIPFNTECISANCRYLKAMLVEFNFEEEKFIDDMDIDN